MGCSKHYSAARCIATTLEASPRSSESRLTNFIVRRWPEHIYSTVQNCTLQTAHCCSHLCNELLPPIFRSIAQYLRKMSSTELYCTVHQYRRRVAILTSVIQTWFSAQYLAEHRIRRVLESRPALRNKRSKQASKAHMCRAEVK